MAYQTKHETLCRAGSGLTTTGYACYVSSMAELDEFLEDYKHCRHDCPSLVLSNELSDRFALWQIAHDKHLTDQRFDGLKEIFGISLAAAKGNGVEILKNLGGLYWTIAKELICESKQPKFLCLSQHFQEILDDGRTLIAMHLSYRGYPFHMRPGSGWLVGLAGVRGQRYIGD